MLGYRGRFVVVFMAGLMAGLALGYLLLEFCEVGEMREASHILPEDLAMVLRRIRFVNAFTGENLSEFRIIEGVVGGYEAGGELYETWVLGFEDRPGGASADQDYLDVLVELKRVRGSSNVTVRIVQLGYDRIDVYVDDVYLGSIRPALEFQIDLAS